MTEPGPTGLTGLLGAAHAPVRSCARCGTDHTTIVFRPLTVPVEVAGTTLTHWAPCPVNGEPILMRVTDTTTEGSEPVSQIVYRVAQVRHLDDGTAEVVAKPEAEHVHTREAAKAGVVWGDLTFTAARRTDWQERAIPAVDDTFTVVLGYMK